MIPMGIRIYFKDGDYEEEINDVCIRKYAEKIIET